MRSFRHHVGAAALVAIALVVTSCGIPTDSSPQAISKAAVPFHLLRPTTPSTTTPQSFVGVPESIYLVDPSQHLTPVVREIAPPATLTEILSALMDGPSKGESSTGLQSFLTGLPSDVHASVTNGLATVDFDSSPIQVGGPDQILAVSQVVFTVTAQPGVTGVVFEIGGIPTDVPISTGALVASPVSQANYAPQAPLAA